MKKEKTMTNSITINNTTNTTPEQAHKLSYNLKFAIFVAAFITAGMLLNLVLGTFASKMGFKAFAPVDILIDAMLSSLIGYFIFLRKKKYEKMLDLSEEKPDRQ